MRERGRGGAASGLQRAGEERGEEGRRRRKKKYKENDKRKKRKKRKERKKERERQGERERERKREMAGIAAATAARHARAPVGRDARDEGKQGDGTATGCRDPVFGRSGDRAGIDFEWTELND